MLILIKCKAQKPLTIAVIFFSLFISGFSYQEALAQGEIVDKDTGGAPEESESSDISCKCIDRCGDGLCQLRGCGYCGFICCETEKNCPQDCDRKKEEVEEFIDKLRQRQKDSQTVASDSEQIKASDELESEVNIQRGLGLITSCHFKAGSRPCGRCYCLKAVGQSVLTFNGRKLRGCARLDISKVGDLSDFVGKTVKYEGTSDFDSTFICPQHFQIFSISLAQDQ